MWAQCACARSARRATRCRTTTTRQTCRPRQSARPPPRPGDPDGVQIDPSGAVRTARRGSSRPPGRAGRANGIRRHGIAAAAARQVAALSATPHGCASTSTRQILSTMPPYLVGAAPTARHRLDDEPEPRHVRVVGRVRETGVLGLPAAARRSSTAPPATRRAGRPGFTSSRRGPSKSSSTPASASTRSAASTSTRPTCCISGTSSRADWPRGAGPARCRRRVRPDRRRPCPRPLRPVVRAAGGVPSSILTHDDELTAAQAEALQAAWVQARQSKLGEPAVLSGGVSWQPTQMNPRDMALVELSDRPRA